jgi:predicted aspartyl protease
MKKVTILTLSFLVLAMLFVSCGNKQPKRPPINFSSNSSNVVKIKYDDRDNNQIWIPVKLNGVTMDMLYDTGFNGSVSMSLLELQILAKQGRFSEDDVLGTSYSSIADGSIVDNGVIRIHTLQIADDLILKNVNASVAMNQEAPMLIGREVFYQVASKVEVDNVNMTLNITPW